MSDVLNFRVLRDYERHNEDWYVENDWTWDLVLAQEHLYGTVLDPCCGRGTSLKALMRAGHSPQMLGGSDIVDRGFRDAHFHVENFLANGRSKIVDNIVMNPPYDLAAKFVMQALRMANRKVLALLPQKFPFSQGRYLLFAETPIKRIYYFSSRPSMPPGDLLEQGVIDAKGGQIDYLAMVWEHGYRGDPTAHWLIRGDHLDSARKAKIPGADMFGCDP